MFIKFLCSHSNHNVPKHTTIATKPQHFLTHQPSHKLIHLFTFLTFELSTFLTLELSKKPVYSLA